MTARARRGSLILVVLLLATLGFAPANAHTNLVSTSPSDGQTLSKAPASVSLRFAADLLDAGARIVAKDDAGAPVTLGQATVDGNTLSADWPSTADSGRYTVSYRTVASDGHPLEGSFAFRIKGTETIAEPSASPVAAEQTAQTEQPGAQSGVNPLVWILLGAGVAGIGVVIWRARAD
jgi:methionine-rich copper-binding protein CopC